MKTKILMGFFALSIGIILTSGTRIPHETDCNLFYHVDDYGMRSLFPSACPENLAFNVHTETCDWPFLVECRYAVPILCPVHRGSGGGGTETRCQCIYGTTSFDTECVLQEYNSIKRHCSDNKSNCSSGNLNCF